MPKDNAHTRRINASQRDDLIKYHCEEISTHLAALKQLHKPTPIHSYAGTLGSLEKMGKYLHSIYVRHGGIRH